MRTRQINHPRDSAANCGGRRVHSAHAPTGTSTACRAELSSPHGLTCAELARIKSLSALSSSDRRSSCGNDSSGSRVTWRGRLSDSCTSTTVYLKVGAGELRAGGSLMKRSSVWSLIGVVLLCFASVAQAAPAKGKKKGKAKEEKIPVSAEISKSMGDLNWGIGKDELQKKLIDKVKDHYKPLIGKTKDAVEEDRLRNAANNEIKKIKDSFVEFRGTSTGWDVSFLRGEFTHGNDEAMIVMRDQNSQNFYFFIGGKLWKWYKAFDASVFPAGNFGTFANGVQRRFGPAKDVSAELRPGEGQRHWLEWQDKATRLRAVDLSDFYGFYSLVFEEKQTVDKLATLRTTKEESGDKRHAMVDSVTSERSDVKDD